MVYINTCEFNFDETYAAKQHPIYFISNFLEIAKCIA
jgi:hypothetical protein